MMTKPSLFWIEPAELSALLGRIGVDGAGLPAASQVPRVANRSLTERPVRATPPARTGLPHFDLPKGSFEERLSALFGWIRSFATFEHAFVVDQDGLALVHESAPLELIAASAAMGEKWNSLRHRFALATESFLSVALTDGQQLHLLTTKTDWGRLSLGLVVRISIPKKDIAAISEQFQRTLEEKENHRP